MRILIFADLDICGTQFSGIMYLRNSVFWNSVFEELNFSGTWYLGNKIFVELSFQELIFPELGTQFFKNLVFEELNISRTRFFRSHTIFFLKFVYWQQSPIGCAGWSVLG